MNYIIVASNDNSIIYSISVILKILKNYLMSFIEENLL